MINPKTSNVEWICGTILFTIVMAFLYFSTVDGLLIRENNLLAAEIEDTPPTPIGNTSLGYSGNLVVADIDPMPIAMIKPNGDFLYLNRAKFTEAIAFINKPDEMLIAWRSDWKDDEPVDQELFAITKDARIRIGEHRIALKDIAALLETFAKLNTLEKPFTMDN